MPGALFHSGVPRAAALGLVVAACVFLSACASRRPAPSGADTGLALKWGERLNHIGPSSPGATGREGEHLIPVEAEIVSLFLPMTKAASLQEDRAKVSFHVVKLPKDAPRPIEYIDLWCPDALVRERVWQVGRTVVVRLTADYSLYDVAD